MSTEERNRRFAVYAGLGVLGLYVASQAAAGDNPPDDSPPDDGNGDNGNGGENDGIGGGDYYVDTPTRAEADYVASSRSALDDALSNASDGDVVFLDTDLPRDGSGDGITVPSGVTLASGRGTDDPTATIRPRGGEAYSPYASISAVHVESDARVTGVVIEGYETRYRRHPDFDSDNGFVIWGMGITTDPDARIDNCEVYGNERGIVADRNVLIEHCDIHHHLQGGLGYGVRCSGANPEIRYCTFDYNRHSLAANGQTPYYVHHNIFGPNHVGHVLDHHGGGSGTVVEYNEVQAVDRPVSLPSIPDNIEVRNGGGRVSSMTVRAKPSPDPVAVRYNWFHNPDGPLYESGCAIGSDSDWHCPAVNQVNSGDPYMETQTDRYHNMDVANNHYGSSEPPNGEIGP